MRALLDTNALIWLSSAPQRLSPRAREVVEDSVNVLILSPVSAFEIALKVSRDRLRLDIGVTHLVELARREAGLIELPLTVEHALRVQHMAWHHRDPFDRMLIAQALVEGMAVVTADGRFADYGVEVVW